MLKNQDIVYIASDWARETKTSAHHIAEVLSAQNRVLYVEGAGMRTPRATRRDFRKIASKVRKLFSKPVALKNNLYLYSPSVLPFHRYRVIRVINRMLLSVSLGRACKTLNFQKPLLWIFVPHFGSALESIDNKGIVYYCTDEYSSNPRVDAATIQLMEREILKKANVAFVVSKRLLESKGRLNPNTYLSRHGVDVELFRKAAFESTQVPDDIATIPRPIAGFFGLLEEWIDADLIGSVAAKLPHISFAFIGRVARDLTPLRKHNNVHFLGHRKYETLPNYLKAFDVCLLVYKQGEFSKHANPKKLREYLAGAKPVVSVRIGEVEEFKDLVYVADNYEEFARLIELALREDSPEKQRERTRAMETESWEAKVDWLSDVIARHIPISSSDANTIGTSQTVGPR